MPCKHLHLHNNIVCLHAILKPTSFQACSKGKHICIYIYIEIKYQYMSRMPIKQIHIFISMYTPSKMPMVK